MEDKHERIRELTCFETLEQVLKTRKKIVRIAFTMFLKATSLEKH